MSVNLFCSQQRWKFWADLESNATVGTIGQSTSHWCLELQHTTTTGSPLRWWYRTLILQPSRGASVVSEFRASPIYEFKKHSWNSLLSIRWSAGGRQDSDHRSRGARPGKETWHGGWPVVTKLGGTKRDYTFGEESSAQSVYTCHDLRYADKYGTGRIKENLAVHKISDAGFRALDQMDKGETGRTVDLGPEWGVSFF